MVHHVAQGFNIILPADAASSLADHMGSIRGISPVVDGERSGLLSLFSALNDTFFMSLLFLLSGLFALGSLERKGSAAFLRDRLLRLGLPLLAMGMLRPLTYYPTHLQSGGEPGLAAFWQAWSALEWRGGPIWFIELLLLFNLVLVVAAPLLERAGSGTSRVAASWVTRPFVGFVVLALLSVLVYAPLTLTTGSFTWVQVGPAQLQVNRLLLYALYFAAGLLLGADGIERSFLVPAASLARRWGLWLAAALVAFLVYVGLAARGENDLPTAVFYALAAATISFAFLALFLRFCQRRTRWSESAFDNSYGIYVIHYGVVGWLLFAFLRVPLAAVAKWAVVSLLAVAICWGATAAIRRIPGATRVL